MNNTQQTEATWRVTFSAAGKRSSHEMTGTREGVRQWARRERHYFVDGMVARFAVTKVAR